MNLLKVEEGAWKDISGRWRQLAGGFYSHGWSLELVESRIDGPFDWAKSFHHNSLEICINNLGHGIVYSDHSQLEFRPGTVGFYAIANKKLNAQRRAGEYTQFVTVEWSRSALAKELKGMEEWLLPPVKAWLEGKREEPLIGSPRPISPSLKSRLESLLSGSFSQPSLTLFAHALSLEAAAEVLFEPNQADIKMCPFSPAHKLIVEKAKEYLKEHFTSSIRLHDLARHVGVSPSYLSRLFSKETGMSISDYVRNLRIEKAAELLKRGDYNVTEAAFAVGYSSLSYFSKVFCQVMGCCPCVYPSPKRLVNKRSTP
ncbi:helix-turn-helix transcriptional regulator [Candidatus Methylacidiphilum infernorum]|uniref:Helix-turn-helix transcriptional regulator n=1 Tax=Candidatus Methylacidiphilum infernorum TaxID=511746 RepID=A0ABX7PV78_9BACT|nr:AraC family transcriptional regulator [Candidatus Methylacidiphilum infernorum]QSR86566.1 helix-turn-helix transcriptional regulator [Candidatus Methylacidiphilum infernorum]